MGTGPPYPPDSLTEDQEELGDDGTMPENVALLAKYVVGSRIVSVERGTVDQGPETYPRILHGLVLTLDSGLRVALADTYQSDACTVLEQFLLHPDRVEHTIVGVATTGGYTHWHIYADAGDVLELTVGWQPASGACGGGYVYGFDIGIAPLSE